MVIFSVPRTGIDNKAARQF